MRNTPWGRLYVEEIDAFKGAVVHYGKAAKAFVDDIVEAEINYRRASRRTDEIVESLVRLREQAYPAQGVGLLPTPRGTSRNLLA